MNKHNPTIVEEQRPNAIENSISLAANDIGFRAAWAVRGYHDRELKDDPRYVKWIVRIYRLVNGEKFERVLPTHKCTPEDFELFYPLKSGLDAQFEV